MTIGSNNSTEQVKKDEPDVPQPVLNVITEDPEIKHITGNMQEPSMEEHGGENVNDMPWIERKHFNGDRPVGVNHVALPRWIEKTEGIRGYIQDYKRYGYERDRSGRIIILERYHAILIEFYTLMYKRIVRARENRNV